ncbi:MAG: hypothetical protein CM15mP74_09660 [Halieaceae bacterium]|nr:MAG: hypothetical protein CM15mP74_09660 [Halieaceae bacterium]
MHACYLSDEQGPWGRNTEPVAMVRQAIRDAGLTTPVISAGGIHGFEQAEALLTEGKADIVGLPVRHWLIRIGSRRCVWDMEMRSCYVATVTTARGWTKTQAGDLRALGSRGA